MPVRRDYYLDGTPACSYLFVWSHEYFSAACATLNYRYKFVVDDCYLKFTCSRRMCLCCCVLGLGSFHLFQVLMMKLLIMISMMIWDIDIEGILDELYEDDL